MDKLNILNAYHLLSSLYEARFCTLFMESVKEPMVNMRFANGKQNGFVVLHSYYYKIIVDTEVLKQSLHTECVVLIEVSFSLP